MKLWIAAIGCLLILACKDTKKDKHPDILSSKEMPANVQVLFQKLKNSPDSIGLRMQLVNSLDSLGAIQQALSQMDSLIKKDSLNYGFWYRKALLQETAKDTTGALRSYRYAIKVYPAPDALLAAANLLAEKKDSTSLSICKQVESLRMGREYTAHCKFISGVYYARTGKFQQAMDAFNATIANDLNYAVAYMEKGFLYFDAKKTNEAKQVFQTLVTVKSTYADGYYWLAKCEETLGNKPEAINNYQKALNFDPGIKEAVTALNRLGVK